VSDTALIRPATDADRAALVALKMQLNANEHRQHVAAGDASADDLDLSQAAAEGTVTRDLAKLAVGEGTVLVAERDGVVIAYVALAEREASTSYLPHARRSLYVAGIVVDAAHRNIGLGAMLLDAAEAEARARGLTRLMLDVSPGSNAQRLYRRAGYAPVSATLMKRLK
jgi:ribosomal protein S18 acetylase RimI-like enzyme